LGLGIKLKIEKSVFIDKEAILFPFRD